MVRLGSSQVHVLHRLLVLLLQVAIEGDVLINGQGFPASMARDELKLGVGQAGMPGQVGSRLMAKTVGRGLHASLPSVTLHDLRDTAGPVLRVSPGLEPPAVLLTSGDMRPDSGGKG